MEEKKPQEEPAYTQKQLRGSNGQQDRRVTPLVIAQSMRNLTQSLRSVDSEVYYYVEPMTYRLIWLSIFLLYFFLMFFLMATALLYFGLTMIPQASYYTTTIQVLPVENFPIILGIYFILAGLYLYNILKMIYYSFKYRELSVGPQQATPAAPVTIDNSTKGFRKTCKDAFKFCCGTTGVCGVRGGFFETVMVFRELLEVVIQTTQAYEASVNVARLWINVTFCALIMTNCLSTPILHLFHKMELGKQRYLTLLSDVFLDLVWFIVLPILFLAPYYNAFIQAADTAMGYEDTFMAKAIMELRFIFATSYFDFFLKVFPALSLLLNIKKLRLLLKRKLPGASQISACAISSCSQARKSFSSCTLAPAIDVKQDNKCIQYTVVRTHSKLQKRIETCLHRFLALWALVVFGLYMAALILKGKCPNKCKLELHPWFTYNTCRCAVQEVSCFDLKIDGSEQTMTKALNDMDPEGLATLIITHCPALEVPQALHQFGDLFNFVIHNSTIVKWSKEDSILSQEYFERIGWVLITLSPLREIPDGMNHMKMPLTLQEIDIIKTNLKTLPLDLEVKWQHVKTLYLEHCEFEEMPHVLQKFKQLETLSLYHNQISFVPDDFFANAKLQYVVFSQNPMFKLPEQIGSLENLYELKIMYTNISTLPKWYLEGISTNTFSPSFVLRAHGSPLCNGDQVNTNLHASGADISKINCKLTFNYYLSTTAAPGEERLGFLGYYPFEGKTKERALVKSPPRSL